MCIREFYVKYKSKKRQEVENTISLDQTVEGTDNLTLLDTIENVNADDTEQYVNENDDSLTVSLMLRGLNIKEEYIIRSLFGVGRDIKTLKELSDELNMSCEGIRILKEKCLSKMKNYGYSK